MYLCLKALRLLKALLVSVEDEIAGRVFSGQLYQIILGSDVWELGGDLSLQKGDNMVKLRELVLRG
jgi:hypothetical protein